MKTISDTPKTPPGYQTARSVLVLGRGAFFGDLSADLPANRPPLLQQDDLVPQFGYVGRLYASTRVLLLGIRAAAPSPSERAAFRRENAWLMRSCLCRAWRV